jgi:hypothetical protein
MTTKFTPGPWAIEYPMGEDNPWIVQDNLPTYEWSCIAMVTRDEEEDRDAKGRFIGGVELLANSRLISAAPDLYAAIANSDDAHWTPAMRAALKKARGE